MEINKAKQKKKLQKKIIPLAMAAVLTVQGTSVPVWGGVRDNYNLGSTYRVTKRAIVAETAVKELTLTDNEKVKITATGYTVGGGEEKAHTGSYVFTTSGKSVTDANIEIENVENADITLKDCHLTSAKDISAENKGIFSFSGGNVDLKLVGTNFIEYTGADDKYDVGSKDNDKKLNINGDGSLYLKNVGIGAGNITITNSKLYGNKRISVDKKLELTGESILAVHELDLGATQTLVLNGDVAIYFKIEAGNGFGGYTPELTKGVLYRGTTVAINSDNSVKLEKGYGTVYGNPNIPDLKKPTDSELFTEINKDDVTVKDVEFTGKEVKPEITVVIDRYITGKKTLAENDYKVEITGDKVNAGKKDITITPTPDSMCKGVAKTEFHIIPKDISAAKIEADLYAWRYKGVAHKIEVKEVILDGVTLTKEDYDIVTGSDTKVNAGSHTLQVEGKGNYKGKAEKKWEIEKAPIFVTEATIAPKTYDGKKDAVVTEVKISGIQNNDILEKGKDYDVTAKFIDENAGKNKEVIVTVTLKNTPKANNYQFVDGKDSIKLTGQEITKGKFEKPRIGGTRYLDDDKPNEKFKYVVSKDEAGYSSEYQMDGIAEDKWQDSNVFKDIEPSSTHDFYMRRKATKNMDASEPDKISFKFDKIDNNKKPPIEYKVTNSKNTGKKKISITTVDGVEYKIGNDADYSDNGIKDNLDPNVPVTIKARFKATKTRNASLDTEVTVDVSKNTYVGPAPTLEEGTYYVDPTNENKFEYKVKTVETAPAGKTYEYSKDLVHWITPSTVGGTVTFGAIEPNSTVNFYARIKAEGEDGAGIQGSRTVTFKKLKRTDSPVIVATVGGIKGDKTVTIAAIKYARYKFGDEDWQNSNVKEHIAGEKIRVGIYIQETTTHEASKQVFKEIVLNEKEGNGSSNDGGSTGGSGSTGPVVSEPSKGNKQDDKKPEPSKNVDKSDNAKEDIKPVAQVTAESVSKNKAEVSVSLADMQKAIEAAKTNDKAIVKLKVAAPKGVKAVNVKLEEGILNSLIDTAIKVFEVTANNVKVQFENKAIALIGNKGEKDIALSIASVSKLSAKEKKIAGKRPVYKVSLKSGETKITNLGEGRVKISIPYNKPVKEKASGLYVAYFNKKGKAVRIKASYDTKNKTLSFSTNYLAKYAIGYKAPKKNK